MSAEVRSLYNRFEQEKCINLQCIARFGVLFVVIGLFFSTFSSLFSNSYKGVKPLYYYHLSLTLLNISIIACSLFSYLRQRHGDGRIVQMPSWLTLTWQCVTLIMGIYSISLPQIQYAQTSAATYLLSLTVLDVIVFGTIFMFALYREFQQYLNPARASHRQYALAATQDLEADDDIEIDSFHHTRFVDDSDSGGFHSGYSNDDLEWGGGAAGDLTDADGGRV
mgnify:CR=1 FL=1